MSDLIFFLPVRSFIVHSIQPMTAAEWPQLASPFEAHLLRNQFISLNFAIWQAVCWCRLAQDYISGVILETASVV